MMLDDFLFNWAAMYEASSEIACLDAVKQTIVIPITAGYNETPANTIIVSWQWLFRWHDKYETTVWINNHIVVFSHQ